MKVKTVQTLELSKEDFDAMKRVYNLMGDFVNEFAKFTVSDNGEIIDANNGNVLLTEAFAYDCMDYLGWLLDAYRIRENTMAVPTIEVQFLR